MGNDGNGMLALFADKIGIAPRVIPVGMAIDDEYLASGAFSFNHLHHLGGVFWTEQGITYHDVAIGDDNIGVYFHSIKFSRCLEFLAKNAHARIIAHLRDVEDAFSN